MINIIKSPNKKYNHKKFIAECKKYKNLVPIAGFDPIQKKENVLISDKQVEDIVSKIEQDNGFKKGEFKNFLKKNISIGILS